jgi:hypothetical protein
MGDIPGGVSHIIGRHWLGSQPGSYMDEFDIIVCCSRRPADMLATRPVIWLPFADSARQPPMADIERVARMVARVNHGRILWHCHAGLNRSALALGVYLVRFRGMIPAEVVDLMRERRAPAVLCNTTFVEALTKCGVDHG